MAYVVNLDGGSLWLLGRSVRAVVYGHLRRSVIDSCFVPWPPVKILTGSSYCPSVFEDGDWRSERSLRVVFVVPLFTGVSFRQSSTSQRLDGPWLFKVVLPCLNLFCRSKSFIGSCAAVASDPLFVVCTWLEVFGLSLSSDLAVKMRCTAWFYGAFSSVSVFGQPIFISSCDSRGSGMLSLPLLLSEMSLKSVERTSLMRSSRTSYSGNITRINRQPRKLGERHLPCG
ncbi:hypothetical protein Bca4012_014534 [Brassica carinata]